jgi:hypothetical protein
MTGPQGSGRRREGGNAVLDNIEALDFRAAVRAL